MYSSGFIVLPGHILTTCTAALFCFVMHLCIPQAVLLFTAYACFLVLRAALADVGLFTQFPNHAADLF